MRNHQLLRALLVMLAAWTILVSGSRLSSRVGDEPAVLVVFSLAAAFLIATRRPFRVRPRLRHAVLYGLASALGFAGYASLCRVIALAGLALGLDPSPLAPPPASGLPLLIAVVLVAPVFEELLYRERLLDAIAATSAGTGGAALLTSALFAITHLAPWPMLGSFLVGMVLALLRRVSRTVAACIGLHAGLNLRSVWESAEGALHG
jgi:membrane protease YdiL (CAAX protease family)